MSHSVGHGSLMFSNGLQMKFCLARQADPETKKVLVFPTNNFDLPALTIAHLYKLRWRVELFFKWIKGHLR